VRQSCGRARERQRQREGRETKESSKPSRGRERDALERAGERVELAPLLDVGGAAKVDQAHVALGVEHDVLVLDVAVHDRVLVEEARGVGDLGEDALQRRRRKAVRVRVDKVEQVLPVTRMRTVRRFGGRRRHDL